MEKPPANSSVSRVTVVVRVEHDDIGTIFRLANARHEQKDQYRDGFSELTHCLIPELMIVKWNVPFYFGGTSLLIIVVVTMDFMQQVQAYAMSNQYESLLKKTNFRGGTVPSREGEKIMKVKASVKKLCRNCKIIRRNNVVRVICKEPRHKQRQG